MNNLLEMLDTVHAQTEDALALVDQYKARLDHARKRLARYQIALAVVAAAWIVSVSILCSVWSVQGHKESPPTSDTRMSRVPIRMYPQSFRPPQTYESFVPSGSVQMNEVCGGSIVVTEEDGGFSCMLPYRR